MSDALESVINIVTSGFAVYAVWLGGKPGDHDHPYGHGRIEDISVAVEGVLVFGAGAAISIVGVRHLFEPPALQNLDAGAIAFAIIGAVTFMAAQALVAAGRRYDTPALVADGEHLRADAVTTLGVLIGLVLVRLTGLVVLDALVALAIAAWLLWTGGSLVRRALRGLMDEVDPERMAAVADGLEKARQPGWLAPHRARVHRLGPKSHVDIHLVAPRYWSLEQAHEVTERVEDALREVLGAQSEANVHMEPCTDMNCPRCDVEDCPIRAAAFAGRAPWTAADIAQIHRRTVPPNALPSETTTTD